MFYATITENFESFCIVTLKQTFWKTKTIKKLDYRILVQSNDTHFFHTKLFCQKPMLKQTEWGVQKKFITKNRVCQLLLYFFWKFCFSLRISYKVLIVTTQMPIFILLVSAAISFEGTFSLWVSLNKSH